MRASLSLDPQAMICAGIMQAVVGQCQPCRRDPVRIKGITLAYLVIETLKINPIIIERIVYKTHNKIGQDVGKHRYITKTVLLHLGPFASGRTYTNIRDVAIVSGVRAFG